MLRPIVKALICVLLSVFGSRCAGQSNNTEVLSASLHRTMTWRTQLNSFDVSCIDSLAISMSTQTRAGVFSESIIKFREFKNERDQEFLMPWVRGVTMIKSEAVNEIIEKTITRSSKSGTIVTRIANDFGDSAMLPCGDISECEDFARNSDWNEWPLLTGPTLTLPQERENLKIGLDYLLGLPNAELDLKDEKLPKTSKKVKVIRAKKIVDMKGVEPDFGFTWKIVISDEGFDKGLIIFYREGRLKSNELNKPYVSDGQLESHPDVHAATEWKEFESDDPSDRNRRKILPVRIVNQYHVSPTNKATRTRTLEWNTFKVPTKEKFEMENGKKICEEYAKSIDKALGR